MAKLRLIIDNVIFLLKEIKEIEIDKKMYYKSDCTTSDTIQSFYYFIKEKKNSITFLSTYKGMEYRIKNGVIHSDSTYAVKNKTENLHFYYLNGVMLSKEKWLKSPEHKNYILRMKIKTIKRNDN